MNAQSNTKNDVAKIIADVMNDANRAGNQQAAMIVAMFANEVTYSANEILAVMRLKGNERTAEIDNMLSAASDSYADMMAGVEDLKERRKASDIKSSDKLKVAFQIDTANRKMRAARMMFTRALQGVYNMRVAKVVKCSTTNLGSGALKVHMPDEDGDIAAHSVSCAEMTRNGASRIAEALGTAKPATARNPANAQATALADSAKAFAASLATIPADKRTIDAFGNEVESNMESALSSLMVLQFGDDRGFLDSKAIAEYVAAYNKTAKENAERERKEKEAKDKLNEKLATAANNGNGEKKTGTNG